MDSNIRVKLMESDWLLTGISRASQAAEAMDSNWIANLYFRYIPYMMKAKTNIATMARASSGVELDMRTPVYTKFISHILDFITHE